MPEGEEREGERVKVIEGGFLGVWVKVIEPRVEEPITESVLKVRFGKGEVWDGGWVLA